MDPIEYSVLRKYRRIGTRLVGANLPGAAHVEPFTGDWFSQFGLSTSRARIYFAHVIVLSSI